MRRALCMILVALVGRFLLAPEASSGAVISVDGGSAAATEDGSAAAPFRTIVAALDTARPGDTVSVRAGTYREQFRIPSGEPGRPLTLRAADGERVVVSGCVRLEGWEPVGGGLWATALDWKPEQLLAAGKPQPIAREPNEGWWRSARAGGDSLADPANLRRDDLAKTGGQLRIWLQAGNVFATLPLNLLDAQTGRVTLDLSDSDARLTDGDKYYLQNRAELIDRAGEWAVEPEGERYRVFFKPRSEEDLGRVEAPRLERSMISIRDASHLLVEGLEVTGSRRDGIEITSAADVTVRRCLLYRNGRMGISVRDAEGSRVAQNIVWHNSSGISVSYSREVVVEENDVAYNGVDGILVTWDSRDVTVRRNYSHHHQLWGHPDNVQLYRDVTGARFEENLLLAGGQSVMMEQTRDGVFRGNMIVGCGSNMLIFGHGNAGHYQVHNNTLALSGYGCMSLTWEGYDVRENVFMTGHAGPVYGVRGIRDYTADRHLFWNTSRVSEPTVMATDTGWHDDFEVARRSTGQDERSVYAAPRFRNAPIAFAVLDSRRLDECTRDTWHLRKGAGEFRPGDLVEANFDGVRRRVTAADGLRISVAPGLSEAPVKGWLVANWADNDDFRLDLRLADDSPAARLSASAGPIGAQIDIQAYQSGDFNGDGLRDLPAVPAELSGE